MIRKISIKDYLMTSISMKMVKSMMFHFPFIQVEILVGKDKGKQGLINCIIKERNWCYIDGLNCVSIPVNIIKIQSSDMIDINRQVFDRYPNYSFFRNTGWKKRNKVECQCVEEKKDLYFSQLKSNQSILLMSKFSVNK